MDLVSVSHSSSFMATVQPCLSFDVFLSFGGEDTREGFTDHLYATLNQADGYESRFISDIVNVIRKNLDYKALYIEEEKLVGIEHQRATNPDPENQEVLEISYKTLKHKELFLHIACFFEGDKKNYIVKLLAECDLYPVVGIKYLIDRCLLYVDVLQDQSGTEKVEELMLDMPEMKEAKSTCSSKKIYGKRMHGNNGNFEIGALEKMKNLMLLQLNYVTLFGKCKKLPRELRLLSWHGFTQKIIPYDIPLEKLVVLDMTYNKLKLVWDDFKVIRSLKILNLSYCVELIKTSDFHGLSGLESLILEGCSSLRKVDESIASLPNLVLLDLTDCTNLKEFPCLPTSLVLLQMSGCRGALARVQCLDSVPSLSFLVRMNISNCNLSDTCLPNDWSSFVALQRLDMDGNNVTSLPKCVQTLPMYKHVMHYDNVLSENKNLLCQTFPPRVFNERRYIDLYFFINFLFHI